MLTCRDLIKRSLKKINILAAGREPTASQAEDALDLLQSLYKELIGQGVFGRLTDVLVTDDAYDAREYDRVVCNNNAGVTVNLPETITSEPCSPYPPSCGPSDYGWRDSTLPRPPRDSAIIAVTDTFSDLDQSYIYDGPRARWVLIDGLALGDTAPLFGRYTEALTSILAERLAPTYGRQLDPAIARQAAYGRSQLSTRYDRQRTTLRTEYL